MRAHVPRMACAALPAMRRAWHHARRIARWGKWGAPQRPLPSSPTRLEALGGWGRGAARAVAQVVAQVLHVPRRRHATGGATAPCGDPRALFPRRAIPQHSHPAAQHLASQRRSCSQVAAPRHVVSARLPATQGLCTSGAHKTAAVSTTAVSGDLPIVTTDRVLTKIRDPLCLMRACLQTPIGTLIIERNTQTATRRRGPRAPGAQKVRLRGSSPSLPEGTTVGTSAGGTPHASDRWLSLTGYLHPRGEPRRRMAKPHLRSI